MAEKVWAQSFAFRSVAALSLLILALPIVGADHAQAHRVRFIASTGSDANNCTRTAPCLTLQRGIDRSVAGSELIVLDSGDFGDGATIDKSITISAIGVSATIGGSITINGAGVTVALRGLRLNGAGAAADGIAIVDAAAVHIVDCEVQNFTNHGIAAIVVGSPTKLFVSGSVSRNNGFEGLVFLAGAGGALTVDNSRFEGNAGSGLDVQFSEARITRTVAAGNGTYGILQLGGTTNVIWTVAAHNGLEGYALFSGGQMTLDHSVARGNLTGLRVEDGSRARISLCEVTNNGTGLLAATGSKILTRKNNTVWSNTTDVTIDATATLKRLKGK
jgi:hypothetical protein